MTPAQIAEAQQRARVPICCPMGGIESWRARSWRRSALQPELPYGLLDFLETGRTIGVREREHGRTHAMGLAIRSLTYPALETRGCSRLVLNASAGTTGGSNVGAMYVSLLGTDGASCVI